jgi:hypothetical protein
MLSPKLLAHPGFLPIVYGLCQIETLLTQGRPSIMHNKSDLETMAPGQHQPVLKRIT